MVDQAVPGTAEQPRRRATAWRRVRLGLVTRIFVLIGLILSVYAGNEIYDGLKRRGAAEAELRSRASSLARLAALDVERTFEAARHAMTVLSSTQAIQDRNLEACSGLLQSVKRDLPMYDFISVDDLDGRILCNDSSPAGRASIRGDPWQIASAAASHDYVVGLHGHSKGTGNEVIRLSYPVLMSDGRVETVLVAGLNLKWLSASIAEWQLPSASVIDIADRNGTLLARYPSSEAVGHKMPEGLRSAIDAPDAGVRLDNGLDGVSRVYGYVPVSIGGVRSILVAVGLDSEPALAEIDRSVWRFVISASVVLFGVAVAAWAYIHRFIRRPIEALLHAAARWQAGDWTARAKGERGIVELEGLASAFDEMAETVAARESALRDSAASLQRSQHHLSRAQRLAAVGSWELDCRTEKLEWSDEYYRILGVSRDTFEATPGGLERMVVEEDRAKLRASIAVLREGRSVPALEFRVIRPDGAIRHLYREAEPLFDAAGTPIGLFGSVRDVTEARETEQLLRRSREHLAHAQRVAATGSFERDLGTGRIEWSDETYRIYGVSRECGPLDIVGIEAMILPEDRERFRAALALGRQGYSGPSPEYRIRRTDGTVRTIYREIEPVLDDAGNRIGVFGVIKDVTELRAAERQRDELENQLHQAQKMEALGTLAGGIAHDLNNSLVPVIALTKVMLMDAREGTAAYEQLSLICQGGERSRDLVERILTFARKSEPQRRETDLRALALSTLKLLRSTLPASIAICERFEQVPPICADGGQLQQVLMNLVTNAAQAIGESIGTITVEIALAAKRPATNRRAAVRLTVIDTGRGMDEGTRARVFEPVFTTKSVNQGTGLGLSIVHGIITGHGGSISVESRVGHGTQFDIFLPIAAEMSVTRQGEAA